MFISTMLAMGSRQGGHWGRANRKQSTIAATERNRNAIVGSMPAGVQVHDGANRSQSQRPLT
eukprot:3637578-Alexandrium_andersonii.AAC.1